MADTFVQNQEEEGLKVVTAQFQKVEPFSWNVFDGFDRIRVLTYSASAQTIVRMLKKYPFAYFECIFGYEDALVADVVKPHQFLNNPARDYPIQCENERQQVIFEGMQADRARFYVVKDNVAHAKLYLLETNGGGRRKVIVGSANFSEPAFRGEQAETLVVFDNDAQAWEHYSREYDAVKEIASEELDMSKALQAAWNGGRTEIERIKQGMTTDGMGGPWIPISRVVEVDLLRRKAPSAIRFPSGEEWPIDYWYEVLLNVAKWLVSKERLTTDELPINGSGERFLFISSVDRSPKGRRFVQPKSVADGIFIETKFDANHLTKYSRRLLAHCSVSLEEVKLRF